MSKKKEKREWKFGEKEGIKGTVRAAITHHPEKFDAKCKDPDKLCPYAIFTAKKEKEDFTPHYKQQKSTKEGTPHKKEKYKNECGNNKACKKCKKLKCFRDWIEENHPDFKE
jgi:hypothetical protein